MVEFRKRINEEILMEINELIIKVVENKNNNEDDDEQNDGTLILDATCAPQNISYPKDTNILNQARIETDKIIDDICYEYNIERPRTYRIKAQREFCSFSKSRRKQIKM